MNYYELLEIRRDSDIEQIRKSYERLSMKALWDKPLRAKLDEAYDTLSDASLRAAYDSSLPPEDDTQSATIQVDRTILTDQQMRTQVLEPQPCPVCQAVNEPSALYCVDCGYELSGGAVEGFEQPAELEMSLVGTGGYQIALKLGANSIGRVGTDVVVPDPSVSRNHAEIYIDDTQILLTDLGSTNGTKLNGKRIAANTAVPLYHMDKLKIGETELEVSCPNYAKPEAAIDDPANEVSAAQQSCYVLSDGSGAIDVRLSFGTSTMGRRPDCDIRITDPYASGRHLKITVSNDNTITVEDLGSTNGTLFHDKPLVAGIGQAVEVGDCIQIGNTSLSFSKVSGEESDNA